MRTAFATLLLIWSLPAWSSVMYRWVDKDGVVNYSQIEPQGIRAEKVVSQGSVGTRTQQPVPTVVEPVPADDDTPKLTEEQQRKLDELKALHALEEQQVAEIRQANCEKSRALLERLRQTAHIRIRADDGAERIIGEDERQRRIEEAQVGIATNCN